MRLAEQKLYQSGRLVPKNQVKLDDNDQEDEAEVQKNYEKKAYQL